MEQPVSVWEALVRSLQSGRSSTRLSGGPGGDLERATSRGSPFHLSRYLAECLSAWVRNQVICRYVLPCPIFYPFSRPPSPSVYFPTDCHPRGSRNGTPRYVPRKEVFPVNTHTYERTCTRTHMLVILLHVISYSFHPSRIDITYSTTSTLKPLSTLSLSRSLDETSESETPRQWRVGNVALIYRLLLYRAIDM